MRSRYHPQVGHTTCGSLAAEHRGQMLRAGASSFHAAARWLRVFIFDFFFFGTATVRLSSAIEPAKAIGNAPMHLLPRWFSSADRVGDHAA